MAYTQDQVNQALSSLLASDPNASRQDVISAAAAYGITPDQVTAAYSSYNAPVATAYDDNGPVYSASAPTPGAYLGGDPTEPSNYYTPPPVVTAPTVAAPAPTPNYEDLVTQAYGGIGRTGEGSGVNQIDPEGKAYWISELEAGNISPESFNQTFNQAVQNYLSQNPEDPYSQMINQQLSALSPSVETEADAISAYTSMANAGYTDDQIRWAAEQKYGPQTDENWAYLTQKAAEATAEPVDVAYDYRGKEYDTDTLLTLASQIAPNIGSLQGGVYGEQNASVGFDYDEAKRILGQDPSVQDQVVLDMARNLIDQGVTDLSQLEVKDITGDYRTQQVYDEFGQPTGQWQVNVPDPNNPEYTTTRILTPEEVAQITSERVQESDYDEIRYTANDILSGRGLFAGEDLLTQVDDLTAPLTLGVGATYTGPGSTQYRLIANPTTGALQFNTIAESSSDMGTIQGILTVASFIPGVNVFAMGANAALAASRGDVLGALASVAGIGEFTNVATALRVASAVEQGNVGALATAIMSNTDISGKVGSVMLTDTVSLSDAVNAGRVVMALNDGNYFAAANAAGSLVDSPDLKTAAAAAQVVAAAASGNISAIANATQTLARTANATQNLSDPKITQEVVRNAQGDVDPYSEDFGFSVYQSAKNAGATEEEALNASNVITGANNLSLTSTFEVDGKTLDGGAIAKTDVVEEPFGQADTVVSTVADRPEITKTTLPVTEQELATQGMRLYDDYVALTGKSALTPEESASLAIATQQAARDPNKPLSSYTIQDLLSGAPSIVGKDDQGRWVDSEGFSYDKDGLKYAPGDNVPKLDVYGVSGGDKQEFENVKSAGDQLVDWANSLEGTTGETVRQTLSTISGATGEQLADLGTALANMGILDRYNALIQIGTALEKTGQSLEIPGVTEAKEAFYSSIANAETYGEKLAAGVKAVVNNPLALVEVAKEVGQEGLPLLLGGGVFKLFGKAAGLTTDLLVNAAESMGSTSRETYQEEIAKGASPEAAQKAADTNGWKAFGITVATMGITDAAIAKRATDAINSLTGRVIGSAAKEGASEGVEEFAISMATGDDLATALTKSATGALIGSKTTGSIQATSDIQQEVTQAFAAQGLTSTDGSFRPETIVPIDSSQQGAVSVEDAIEATETSETAPISEEVAPVVGGTEQITTAPEVAGIAESSDISTDPVTGITTEIQTNPDTGDVTKTETNPVTGDTTTVVTNPDTGVTNTSVVNADTGSTTQTTIDSNTGINNQSSVTGNVTSDTTTNTNNNISTNVTTNPDTNTQVTTTTNGNTNVTTQVTVDSNANTQTTVTTNSNGQVVTESTIDNNNNTETTVQTDPKTNTSTTVVVDLNTNTVVDSWTDTNVDPKTVDPVTPVTEPTTETTTETKTETKTTTPSKLQLPKTAAQPSGILGGVAGGAGEIGRLAPQMLKSWVTGEKYIDPLSRVRESQKEMERDAIMQQIDPRLASILQNRMGEQKQDLSGLGTIAGALSGLFSGSEKPSNDSYYSYGTEDSIDDILASAGRNYAEGGYVEPLMAEGGMTLPLLAKRGGLPKMTGGREDFRDGKHVAGEGDGQSDDIPAMLADGEFVFPADVVSALGNGSSKAGTDKLYKMMHEIRARARSTGNKDLPPPAFKSPLDYLKSKRVRSQK